jgi:hypothetical protein
MRKACTAGRRDAWGVFVERLLPLATTTDPEKVLV